jgi:hypothetical protein
MRQLAKFETAKNRDWFSDPNKFWYQAVFGKKIARRIDKGGLRAVPAIRADARVRD